MGITSPPNALPGGRVVEDVPPIIPAATVAQALWSEGVGLPSQGKSGDGAMMARKRDDLSGVSGAETSGIWKLGQGGSGHCQQPCELLSEECWGCCLLKFRHTTRPHQCGGCSPWVIWDPNEDSAAALSPLGCSDVPIKELRVQPCRPPKALPNYTKCVESPSHWASDPRVGVIYSWPTVEIETDGMVTMEPPVCKLPPSRPYVNVQAGPPPNEMPMQIYMDDWITIWEAKAEGEASPDSHLVTCLRPSSGSSDEPHLEGTASINQMVTRQEEDMARSCSAGSKEDEMEKVSWIIRHTNVSQAVTTDGLVRGDILDCTSASADDCQHG